MADLVGSSMDGVPGPPLNELTLAERCPGFSSTSYYWAINDGYVLTRK
jgi:hypothetical protein